MDKIIQIIKIGEYPEDRVLALTRNGNIYRLNPHMGQPKWEFITKSPKLTTAVGSLDHP